MRKDKKLTFDESKLKYYEEYCEKTGRVLSRVLEIAMDEYIRKNHIDD